MCCCGCGRARYLLRRVFCCLSVELKAWRRRPNVRCCKFVGPRSQCMLMSWALLLESFFLGVRAKFFLLNEKLPSVHSGLSSSPCAHFCPAKPSIKIHPNAYSTPSFSAFPRQFSQKANYRNAFFPPRGRRAHGGRLRAGGLRCHVIRLQSKPDVRIAKCNRTDSFCGCRGIESSCNAMQRPPIFADAHASPKPHTHVRQLANLI